MPPESIFRRRGTIALLVAAILLCIAQSLYFEWKPDDAYIAFVYARNWVDGHGLVFNIGERVEGYTCFLWVALCALGRLTGADIPQWSTALGIGSALGTILVSYHLAHDLAPADSRVGAAGAALLVGTYPGVAWWASSGMETMLFTFLMTAAIWRHVRDGARSVSAPVLLALLSLTRPEGWLLGPLLCLDAVRQGPRKHAVRYAAIYAGLFAPYYTWRCWYYGYPFPNTFYAKVGNSLEQIARGVKYVLRFAGPGCGALLALPALLFRRSSGRHLAGVYTLLAIYGLSVVAVGGDVFSLSRFLVPLVPTLIALSVAGVLTSIACAQHRRRASMLAAGWVVILAANYAWMFSYLPENLRFAMATRDMMREPCQRLPQLTGPDDAIASAGIGLLKFCTGARVIDMLGLTDEHIAHRAMPDMGRGIQGHEKHDADYVLAQRPKFIVMPRADVARAWGNAWWLNLPAFREIWEHPVLQREYVPEIVGYRRKDVPPLAPGHDAGQRPREVP
jgi:arabinofuranosyltransferase